MDVYHKVLRKLNDVTGGKETKRVDFRDLLKSLGFFSSYSEIFERMKDEGWIIEDSTPNHVRLTHWGIIEDKKSSGEKNDATEDRRAEIKRLSENARELASLIESLADEKSKTVIVTVEKKFEAFSTAFDHLRKNS
jgi:hypothetical protein